MAWHNSDDILLPGAIQTIVDYFGGHQEIDVIYRDRRLIAENDMEIGRRTMPGHDSAILSWVDCVPQETMFWRRHTRTTTPITLPTWSAALRWPRGCMIQATNTLTRAYSGRVPFDPPICILLNERAGSPHD